MGQSKGMYEVRIHTHYTNDTLANAKCQCLNDGASFCPPVDSAKICVYADDNLIKTFYTDSAGNCTKFKLRGGSYRIDILKKGMESISSQVALITGADDCVCNFFGSPPIAAWYVSNSIFEVCAYIHPEKKKGVRIVPR